MGPSCSDVVLLIGPGLLGLLLSSGRGPLLSKSVNKILNSHRSIRVPMLAIKTGQLAASNQRLWNSQ